MKTSLKRIVAVLISTVLAAALVLPALAANTQSIRVGSYKGTTLAVGERSSLMIGPSGPMYTVTSSDPDTVAVEQVMNFWVVIAKAKGSAEITVSNQTGETGTLTLTVGPIVPQPPTAEDSSGQSEVSDARLELVRLVNEVRRASGAAELISSDELMEAAQACADQRFLYHNNRAECEAVARSGYPYGFGSNLCIMTGASGADTPQRAVTSWVNSPGHYKTMVDPACDSMGVGIAESDGITHCYLFVGKPGTINPYG